jgi:hypothetical protein
MLVIVVVNQSIMGQPPLQYKTNCQPSQAIFSPICDNAHLR